MQTTTLDIFVDILQRLHEAKGEVGINTTMETEEYIEEDDEGNEEVIFEKGPCEVFFMVEAKIAVDEKQNLVVDDQVIEDVEDALFEAHESRRTDIKQFCTLITELADAGHGVQTKVGDEDVRVLEIEHIDDNEGLKDLERILSRGRLKIRYVPFDNEKGSKTKESNYQIAEHIPSYQDFLIWYNEEEACYRLYPRGVDETDIEDALEYYKNTFLPKIQAAREYGEIPGLTFH